MATVTSASVSQKKSNLPTDDEILALVREWIAASDMPDERKVRLYAGLELMTKEQRAPVIKMFLETQNKVKIAQEKRKKKVDKIVDKFDSEVKGLVRKHHSLIRKKREKHQQNKETKKLKKMEKELRKK